MGRFVLYLNGESTGEAEGVPFEDSRFERCSDIATHLDVETKHHPRWVRFGDCVVHTQQIKLIELEEVF